jgi:tetratricopeptide (TPR) repeat protein
MESSMRDLSEPNSSDKPEVAFAKALRLVMAEPNRVRFLVGLADYYSEGGFRTALLDEAVAAIERDREQPDAAFWLASALWRKREMTRRVYHDPAPQYRAANALTNDFSRLLEWFPTSQEAHSLVEVTNRGEGNYTHVRAKYGRYLGAVFTNIVARPKPPVVAVAPVKAPAVTDAQRQARLDDYLRQGRTVLAWQVVNSIRTADDSSVQPQVRRVYDDLQEVVLREYREFKVFTNAVAQKESQRALDLGRTLLNCALRQQRLEVIEKCGELLKEAKGFPEQFEFVFAQAQRYRNDFLLDPVTGAPGVHIVFRIEGNPPVATRWTTYGFDYAYARVVGELVEAARARARPDLAAKIFEALRNDETLPLRNRLTAAYDLALMEHEQGRHFEALELLKEVLRETEGTGLPLARKESWSSERIETLAFDALRKIRLYTGAEVDVCGCCGEIPSVLPPKPANFEEMDRLLGELWKQTTGGVGADNRLVKQQLLERKGDFMPAILYKLRNDQEVSHMLIFCGQLGTNAAVALPVIVQFICHGERFQDYNNALSALGGIGKPAACAKPLLILAMEDSRSVFNAEYALKKVGPAPRRVMPYLAQLLHHKNAAICEQAARAMIETANMDKDAFAGKSGEPLVLALRQWWEAQGVKQAWSQK